MSDRMAARIWIGGSAPEKLVPELCKRIRDSGATPEFGSEPFEPTSAEDLLRARQPCGDALLLELCDEEAAWGRFEQLESFLRRQGISYTRHSDGKYEYDPEIVEYRPKEGCFEIPANAEPRPVVLAEEVARVAEALEALSPVFTIDTFKRLVRKLRKLLPPELPPLKSFEIVAASNENESRRQNP